MAEKTKIDRINFFEGMNNGISDLSIPPTEMALAVNVDCGDKPGTFRLRPGTDAEGDEIQDGKNMLGLFYYKAGTTSRFIAACNTADNTNIQLKYNNSADGNWASVVITDIWNGSAGVFENAIVSGAVLVDDLFLCGYDSADNVFPPLITLSDVTPSASINLDNSIIDGAKFNLVYQDRMFFFNTSENGTAYPSRVRWSSLPSAGVITWPTANYVDIYEKDGEEIMGAAVLDDMLYIFKETYCEIRRFSGTSLIRIGKIDDVGAAGFRAVTAYKGYIYLLNSTGVYRIKGSSQEKISNAENEVFAAMSSWSSCLLWGADDKIYCYVGTVTSIGIGARTLTYGVLVFNTRILKWTEWEASGAIGCATLKGKTAYIGQADGFVHKISNAIFTDDFNGTTGANLTPIPFQIKTQPLCQNGWEFIKNYKEIFIRANDFSNLIVNYYIDKKSKPNRLGSLRDRISRFIGTARGREIEIEITGNTKYNFELSQISIVYESESINSQ